VINCQILNVSVVLTLAQQFDLDIIDLLHESFVLTLALSPRRGNKRFCSLLPGEKGWGGLAPLCAEGCPVHAGGLLTTWAVQISLQDERLALPEVG